MYEACNFYGLMWRLDLALQFDEVIILSKVGTAFPVQDAYWCGGKVIELNYLTLLGVDSPLPHYLLCLGLHSESFQAFLRMFNQRAGQLLYTIWRQTHPLANAKGANQLLSAILGANEINLPELIACATNLIPRTARGLCQFLQMYFKGISVVLSENAVFYYPVSNRCGLAKSLQLADNIVLGDQVLDVMRCFRIEIGPVSMKQSLSLRHLKFIISTLFKGFVVVFVVYRQLDCLPIQLGQKFIFKTPKTLRYLS